MNILVLTFGNPSAGSTKFRITQYDSILRRNGFILDYVQRSDIGASLIKRIPEYDVVLNQKCIFKINLEKKILRASRKLIFDFDDAIWTRHGKNYDFFTRLRVLNRLHYWLSYADMVIPANRYLAEYAHKYNDNITVLPMALDLSDWAPSQRRNKTENSQQPIYIGWAGAPVNLKYLEMIDGPLSKILSKYPNTKLRVFSGQRPELSFDFEYVPFKDGLEPDFVRSLDIGLLPMNEDEFAKGKSPIKAIQYLSCEVPVVGNIYGATSEILNDQNSISVRSNDWESAISKLIENPEKRISFGKAGRKHVEENYNSAKVGKAFMRAISECVST